PQSFWNRVFWTDKSKIKLFESDEKNFHSTMNQHMYVEIQKRNLKGNWKKLFWTAWENINPEITVASFETARVRRHAERAEETRQRNGSELVQRSRPFPAVRARRTI
ncbi:hypothetical protein ALC56_02023, partial [Trachymyrmex septentrionalis]